MRTESAGSFRLEGGPPKYRGRTLDEILAMPNGRAYLEFLSHGRAAITPEVEQVREFLREHPRVEQRIDWLDREGNQRAGSCR